MCANAMIGANGGVITLAARYNLNRLKPNADASPAQIQGLDPNRGRQPMKTPTPIAAAA